MEKGSQHWVRRLLTWEMQTEMQDSVPSWGVRGRVMCIGLASSYFLELRASELFTMEKGLFHKVLRTSDNVALG